MKTVGAKVCMIPSPRHRELFAGLEVLHSCPLGEACTFEVVNAYGARFHDLKSLLELIRGKHGDAHHHPLSGPIHVEGASPGDVLEVELVDIQAEEMAQALSRSAGIDPVSSEHFGDRAPTIGTLHEDERGKRWVKVQNGRSLPYRPMLGICGTAPASGRVRTGHTGRTGGNLDLPFLSPGNRIFLPVEVPGGLVFLGDTHSLQAYGELGGIAMECSATVTVRFALRSPNPGWTEPDPYLATPRDSAVPLLISGVEPLSGERGIGVVGVGADHSLDTAIREVYQNSVALLKLLQPSLSWGDARNLVSLIGHSINGQAASRTAEPTTMIFFRECDLKVVFDPTSESVLEEAVELLLPGKLL
jgi:acetamidase/formamidase